MELIENTNNYLFYKGIDHNFINEINENDGNMYIFFTENYSTDIRNEIIDTILTDENKDIPACEINKINVIIYQYSSPKNFKTVYNALRDRILNNSQNIFNI